MANDMVTAAELSHLPGAPFTDGEVDTAVETLRRAIGWHIAPEQTETLTLDVHYRENRLRLQTAKLVEVSEIREKATGTVIPATSYEASGQLSIIRKLSGYWPSGMGAVEVDLTHGYEEVPKDLLSIIAAIAATMRRDQTVRQAIAGTYVLPLVGIDNVVYRYVPWWTRFGMA